MKLILENFRCYDNFTFTTKDIGTILLNGKSGIGKSSIFKAISFVLYNKEQKVIKYGKKKCKVIFHFNDIIITRTKSPNSLSLIKNNISYIEDSAQEIIHKVFGNNFYINGYVCQKNIEGFFQLSKDSKTSFLQQLAIDEYPIELLKNDVKNKLKICKDLLATSTTKVNTLKSLNKEVIISPLLSSNMLTYLTLVTREDLVNDCDILYKYIGDVYTELNTNIQKEMITIQNLNKEQNKYIVLHSIQKEYIEKLNITELLLECDVDTFLLKYNNEMNVYNRYVSDVNKEVEYNKKKSDLIKDNELNKNNLSKFNINCKVIESREIFNKYKSDTLEVELEKQLLLKISIESELNKCEEIIENNNQIKKQIYILEKGKSLHCPECNQKVLFIDNKLIKDENNDILILKKLKDSIVKIDSSELKQKLDSINSTIHSIQNINKDFLSYKIKIVNEYINIYSNYLYQNDINSKVLSIITKDLSKLSLSVPPRNNKQIEKDIKYYTEYKEYLQKLSKYGGYRVDNIELINTCSNNLSNLQSEYKRVEILKEESNVYKQNYNKYKEYYSFTESLNKEKLEEESHRKKYFILESFLNKICLTESQTLESVIDTINLQLDILMDKFFNSKLTMYLTSTKTNVNGDKKFQTDIIFYDENQTSIMIDNLSGGEYDRCVLALTLTLNKLSKTPILLLDECLSSLHSECVEDIVDTIKELIHPKLVIITLHQANVGIFDDVINLE